MPESEKIVGTALDKLFGRAVAPTRFDPKEGELTPRSRQLLDAKSAALLKGLISVTESGLGISAFVYCEMPILWLIDADGNVIFALEEIVEDATNAFALPRLRHAGVEAGHSRLGHPSLVSAKPARIGGEILYDVRASRPCWIITNGSGRYGIGHDRREEHLHRACARFEEHGIIFKPFFFHPVGALQ